MPRQHNIKRFFRRHPLRIGVATVIAAILILLTVFSLVHKYSRPEAGVITSTSPTNTVSSRPEKKTAAPNPAPTATSKTTGPGPKTSGGPPIFPYGDFVSSHRVSSGITEASVCNSTPGATCYIKFTNGSQVKTLSNQTLDANGAAYWNWTVSLDKGSWTISAVATLNGQMRSTSDSQPLVVQ